MHAREFVKVLTASISKEDLLEEVSDRHLLIYLPRLQVQGHFDIRFFEHLDGKPPSFVEQLRDMRKQSDPKSFEFDSFFAKLSRMTAGIRGIGNLRCF